MPGSARSRGGNRQTLGLRLNPRADLPLFAQIQQQIAWLIASNKLEAATRLPTIRELARDLKVNLHTVRRAYHALEADGLLETRPGRGTRVRPFVPGQLLPRQTALPSHTVGVLLPNLVPFYAKFVQGLEEAARRLGYLLFVGLTGDDPDETRILAQQLASKDVDGLVAVAMRAPLMDGRLSGVPTVYVDTPGAPANSVLFNLELAGLQATRHLIWHGHKRIGLITAPLSWENNRDAARGFREALRQGGLRAEERWIIEVPGYAREAGYRAGQELCKLPKGPTAVFASGDILALGAMQAIRDSGRRVPQDMAVASKDNIEFSAFSEPPLTTVSLPVVEAGGESMEMLHGVIRDGARRKRRVLRGTRLVIRQSCGCE